jgi:hypothetical protein
MELCSVPIRRARAQLIRTVQGREGATCEPVHPVWSCYPCPSRRRSTGRVATVYSPNIVAALSSQAWWIRTYVTTEASERCRVWCAIARSEARRWRS